MENRRLRIFSRPRIGSSPGLSFAFTCWKFWHLATIYCLSKNHEMRLSEASDHHSSISGYYFWQICNIQVELQKDLQTLPPWQIIIGVSSKQKAHKRKLESDSLTFFFLLFLSQTTTTVHDHSGLPFCPQLELPTVNVSGCTVVWVFFVPIKTHASSSYLRSLLDTWSCWPCKSTWELFPSPSFVFAHNQ